jgi:hypothetical protein
MSNGVDPVQGTFSKIMSDNLHSASVNGNGNGAVMESLLAALAHVMAKNNRVLMTDRETQTTEDEVVKEQDKEKKHSTTTDANINDASEKKSRKPLHHEATPPTTKTTEALPVREKVIIPLIRNYRVRKKFIMGLESKKAKTKSMTLAGNKTAKNIAAKNSHLNITNATADKTTKKKVSKEAAKSECEEKTEKTEKTSLIKSNLDCPNEPIGDLQEKPEESDRCAKDRHAFQLSIFFNNHDHNIFPFFSGQVLPQNQTLQRKSDGELHLDKTGIHHDY